MTTKAKRKRNDTAKLIEASGFSVTVKLTGYCAVDHFQMCATIKDVERCAVMGDFKIISYDYEVAA